MENIGKALRGMYRDTVFDSADRLIYDSGWMSNTIVENGRILLASLMKGEDVGGICYMKVGKGLSAWGGEPEAAAASVEDLETPYEQTILIKSDQDIFYLDENGDQTSKPTSRLEVRVAMEQGFPVANQTCDLREFGLFNKDLRMINCVYHPLIQKAATETLIRTIRLFF